MLLTSPTPTLSLSPPKPICLSRCEADRPDTAQLAAFAKEKEFMLYSQQPRWDERPKCRRRNINRSTTGTSEEPSTKLRRWDSSSSFAEVSISDPSSNWTKLKFKICHDLSTLVDNVERMSSDIITSPDVGFHPALSYQRSDMVQNLIHLNTLISSSRKDWKDTLERIGTEAKDRTYPGENCGWLWPARRRLRICASISFSR